MTVMALEVTGGNGLGHGLPPLVTQRAFAEGHRAPLQAGGGSAWTLAGVRNEGQRRRLLDRRGLGLGQAAHPVPSTVPALCGTRGRIKARWGNEGLSGQG